LARAKVGAKAADDAEKGLADEIAGLREKAGKGGNERAAGWLAAAERQVAVLKKANEELASAVQKLEAVEARSRDPNVTAQILQAERLRDQIGRSLTRGEVDEAIRAYELLIALVPTDDGVKRQLEELKKKWATKSPDHAKQRDFLLKTWPSLATIQDLSDGLSGLGRAIEVCKENDDVFALRKAHLAIIKSNVDL